MQYVYILDYSTPSRLTLKVDDKVDLSKSEIMEKLLKSYHLRLTDCSWLISDHEIEEEEHLGITTGL